MRHQHSPQPSGPTPVPLWKDPHATFETSPLPRHRARRMYDARPTSRANHPTYYGFKLHLLNTSADNHGTPHDDDRSPSSGANVSPTAGPDARGDVKSLSATHRGSHPPVLGPVRSLHGAVGDHDRLARIELSARRGEPDRLLRDLPNGSSVARWALRCRRVPGLVLGAIRCGSEHRGRRGALCGLGIVTLATLIGKVI